MEQNSDNKIELLAPAGDFETLKYAVAGGCDAVYLGMTDFNARSKAKNFSEQQLRLAVLYCHEHGVRVYLTLNTLVKDSELNKAVLAAKTAYELGVDAVLVQDIILLTQIKKEMPDLPVHASTQMGVHNLEGAVYAKKLGVDRIVLSREATAVDSKNIAEAGIETEMFIHGAMCVSFSGNCYFSSFVSGYSGNRGKCLQLCRKKYTLESGGNKKTGYMLSPKDICMLPSLDKIRRLGVRSLKIEGRLRSREYAFVTSDVYSRALTGKTIPDDMVNLKIVFNRGDFSTAYLLNDKPDLIYDKQQNNIGTYAGKVLSVRPFRISGYTPVGGDGFKLLRGGREIGGAEFSGGRFTENGNARIGDSVHLTKSGRLSSVAAARVNERSVKFPVESMKAENTTGISEYIPVPYLLPDKCLILKADDSTADDLFRRFDLIIYAPSEYGIHSASAFRKKTGLPVLLDMPPIARGHDINILKAIVSQDIFDGYVANNLYALELCRNKPILPGIGLNLLSHTSFNKISSVESAVCETGDAVYAYGRYTLMYLSHCPKRQLGQSCGKCNNAGISLTDESGNQFALRRVKMNYCYFELINSKITNLLPKLDRSKHRKIIIDAVSMDKSQILEACDKLYNLPFDAAAHTSGRFGKGVK